MWTDHPCKLSTRSLDGAGYPKLTVNGKTVTEHRYVLEQKLERPIRGGYLALHACNVKRCIEPSHLYEGTYSQNIRDSYRAGRSGKKQLKTHCLRGHPLSGDNLYVCYGKRTCRECYRILAKKRKAG